MADNKAKRAPAATASRAGERGDRWHLVQQGNIFRKVQSAEAPDLAVERLQKTKVLIGSGSKEDIDKLAANMASAYANAVIEE